MVDQKLSDRPVVLITGSEGLVGDAAVLGLEASYGVSQFDIARPTKQPQQGAFIPCDLTQDDSVEKALETLRERRGSRLASVIHLAAYYDFSGQPSPLYDKITIEGTRRLLRGLQSFHVDQFVFTSSMLVMKPAAKGETLTESSDIQAEWDYPKSKLYAEQVIREERGHIKAVLARIAGVYDDECHSIPLAQQITRIYEKQMESYFFPGDTDKGQSFVHLDDLVECFRKIVERRKQLDDVEIFLVGHPDVMSYEELQDAIGELIHQQEWPALRIPKPVAKAGAWVQNKLESDEQFIKPWMIDLADQHYPLSIQKAREKLGWEPQRQLRDTLPRMVGALLSNPAKWYAGNNLELPQSERGSSRLREMARHVEG